MATELECPVDFITVNENKVRLTALNVFILAVVYLIIPHWIIPAFLSIDFFLRGFNFGKYSLLNILSEKEVQLFSIKPKPIDQAPKRFAAKIGFIFSVAILAATLFNFISAGIVLAVILTVFAFLESFLGFCAGCYAYTFYNRLFLKSRKQAVN
ncbi:DUF4395 domain-containing protein [Ferruginibacter sp. SUN106]|uniref:DUF4395 domain-containing protein n=1 Tax=Ferruginibacter sp. SUN106 TaxID=2978348 RepID=UPI003D369D9C